MASTDVVFPRLEEAALGALEDYQAFRTYQGSSPDYYKRARLGMPVLSTYGRVRGTRANERALALMEQKIASGGVMPKTLPALAGVSNEGDTGNGASGQALTQVVADGTARETGRKVVQGKR